MFAYFDIGGTKTRVAVSHDGLTFSEPVKFETPGDFDAGIRAIEEAVRHLAGESPIRAMGGGIAGPVDTARTTLVNSPNLHEWVLKPITRTLSDALGTPVYIENDSAVVALGEAHHGAGKGDPIMAYITVSTGIGGARIVNGSIDVSAYGFEPGHQYIDFDQSACPECIGAQAEDYLSGTATEHRFHVKPYEVEGADVWEKLAEWLAYALNNTIVHWSPHSVVLGGSMIVGNPAIPVDRVAHHLNRVCTIYPVKPAIRRAELGDLGGLYGAMELVKQKMAQ
jgi:glucokinase